MTPLPSRHPWPLWHPLDPRNPLPRLGESWLELKRACVFLARLAPSSLAFQGGAANAVRGGLARYAGHRLRRVVVRLRDSSQGLQRHRRVEVRFGKIWFEPQRLGVPCDGLFEASLLLQDVREIVMSNSEVGLQAHRGFTLTPCIVKTAKRTQRAAQSAVRKAKFGTRRECRLVVLPRLVESAQLLLHAGEIVLSFHRVRPKSHGRCVLCDRLIEPALRLQHAGEVVVQHCKIRLQSDRGRAAPPRFV